MKTKYKQPEIPEQYTKYLFEDEYVILYGDIVKRSVRFLYTESTFSIFKSIFTI